MSGTLFVVATPIGNLEDITIRALRVLGEAALVAAEDTRRTARLFARHGLATPLISFHAHNAAARLPQLLQRLEAGARVALVSDAGTPGLADPGVELVRACRARGIPVDPVPGASAPLTAAVASGFPLVPLTIHGFVPSRAKDRSAWIAAVNAIPHTVTFFEAPHRILRTLGEAAPMWGDRPIVLARELTKLHQELMEGTAATLAARLHSPRGEFTGVLGPAAISRDTSGLEATDARVAEEFGQLTTGAALGRRAAVLSLARKYGRPAREVYAAIERVKDSE